MIKMMMAMTIVMIKMIVTMMMIDQDDDEHLMITFIYKYLHHLMNDDHIKLLTHHTYTLVTICSHSLISNVSLSNYLSVYPHPISIIIIMIIIMITIIINNIINNIIKIIIIIIIIILKFS